jgi:uncharacterized membrane protein
MAMSQQRNPPHFQHHVLCKNLVFQEKKMSNKLHHINFLLFAFMLMCFMSFFVPVLSAAEVSGPGQNIRTEHPQRYRA